MEFESLLKKELENILNNLVDNENFILENISYLISNMCQQLLYDYFDDHNFVHLKDKID